MSPPDPAKIRPCLDTLLLAWRRAFGRPAATVAPYELEVAGPDLHLWVESPGGRRAVRGRLSAFALLAGRFWAAGDLDAEGWRLCQAWVPTLAEVPGGRPGLEAVRAQPGFVGALREAAAHLSEAGEEDEAALCLAQSVDWGGTVPVSSLSVPLQGRVARAQERRAAAGDVDGLLMGLKHADPLRRLAAARGCEALPEGAVAGSVLDGFRVFRAPVRVLLVDVQPAIHERALALAETWARRLWAGRAWREALLLLDDLIDTSVAIGDTLRLRLECRLAIGDLAGASNDRARLGALQPRIPDLLAPAVGGVLPADLDEWHAAALARVAEAHEVWAEGGDPCAGRAVVPTRPSFSARQRHLLAARARYDEALALLARDGGAPADPGRVAALRARRAVVARAATPRRSRKD